MNKELQRLGCELIGTFGKGDDGKGVLDEDYNDWKFDMMPMIASRFGVMSQLKKKEYAESFKVISNVDSKKFAHGEIVGSLRDLMFINRPPFHESKPFIAKFDNFKVIYDLHDGKHHYDDDMMMMMMMIFKKREERVYIVRSIFLDQS
ncbi:unnamed protein product [Ambrosiozyma monospora]|uniref:Unnamed protein product n=1 Tax=Ambrosiozyma monospora TaxID=43982 RepID=A0A9W6Z4Q5_AMBMO|nr:unnamed protein product [Ambrosiozyma monospora]